MRPAPTTPELGGGADFLARRQKEFAVHESGHAVYAVLHNLPLVYTTIDLARAPRGSNGYTHFSAKLPNDSEATDIFLTGIAAQFATGDPADINRIVEECLNDMKRAWFAAFWRDAQRAEWGLIESLWRAECFAAANIPAIRAVADQLLIRRTLLAAEVARVIATNR